MIVIGITGSIAAFKAPLIVRQLQENGCTVRCVMTESAEKFVSPLVLSTFCQERVYSKLIDDASYKMPHLDLAKSADLFLIAPCSATVSNPRCAHGSAEDLVSLTALTTTAPVLFAPAMHDTMWLHPATQDNVKILTSRKNKFVGPVKGKLADNDSAVGRMAEPEEIVKAALSIVE